MSTKIEDLPKEEKERIWGLMKAVNADILQERLNQNKKWGHQRHSNGRWLAILVEEVGESAQAIQTDMVSHKGTDADNLYEELIQVAAVAQAWAEQVREKK